MMSELDKINSSGAATERNKMQTYTDHWTPTRKAWLQKIFDTGVKGLLAQGHRSIGDDKSCKYRGPGNDMCALGFSITDKKYQTIWDTLEEGVTPYVENNSDKLAMQKACKSLAKTLGCKTNAEATALRAFQDCHDVADNTNFVSSFKSRAQIFAINWGVDAAALGEVT